jgi:hypothetical protein
MRRKENRIVFVAILLVPVFGLGLAFAQTLPSVDARSVEADSTSGMPVQEIISAVNDGGLSTAQNLDELQPILEEQPSETFILPMPTEPNQPDPPPAAFTPDSLKDLEAQGGLSTRAEIDAETPTVFKLAVKFFERVVFRNDVEFVKRPIFDEGFDMSGMPTFDKDTAGYAIIKKGSQSVTVDFEKVYNSPPVVTATLSLEQYDDPEVWAAAADLLLVSDVKYIVSKVSKKGFEILMDRKADSDIPFSWHALSVEKPKTSKKKGDTLGNDRYSVSGNIPPD